MKNEVDDESWRLHRPKNWSLYRWATAEANRMRVLELQSARCVLYEGHDPHVMQTGGVNVPCGGGRKAYR